MAIHFGPILVAQSGRSDEAHPAGAIEHQQRNALDVEGVLTFAEHVSMAANNLSLLFRRNPSSQGVRMARSYRGRDIVGYQYSVPAPR